MSNDQINIHKDPYEIDIIRSETALRYPIHSLSTNGKIRIEITKRDDKGIVIFGWEVTHNSKYGPPGRLAYKLDKLIINRRIDEAIRGGRPVPKLLKLGSLREIAQSLGLGTNTNKVKKALHQNASAYLVIKGLLYHTKDKTEQHFEFGDNRYGVRFTGETLPNGAKADAVYIVLHDDYRQLLDRAAMRPLDYDYLSSLAPTPQRFYEIISYEMLPAIRFKHRAKLPYSEFCMYSTMTRYEKFEQVKKQMWNIHRPHIKSGYLAKVEYEPTTDEEGHPDWNIFYTPGERARFQQLVFSFEIPNVRKERTKSEHTPKRVVKLGTTSQELLPILSIPPDQNEKAVSIIKTFYRLRFGATHTPTAREIEQATSLVAEGAAWANYLVEFAARSGKEQSGFPEHFGGIASLAPKIRGDFDSLQQKQEVIRLKKARQSHQDAHRDAYHAFLGELLGGRLESALPEAFTVFSAQEKSAYLFHKARAVKSRISAQVVEEYYSDAERIRRLLLFIGENPKSGVPNFWQWDEKINPARFQDPK